MSALVTLVPASDLLMRDDEALLLYDTDLYRITAIPTAIVRACQGRPHTIDELAELLGERFGMPEDVDLLEATRTTVDDLATMGIVTLTEASH